METIERSLRENEERFFKNHHLLVSDVMSKDVITLHPKDTLSTITEIMEYNLLSHMPIVDEDKRLVGLITKKDIMSISLPSSKEKNNNLNFDTNTCAKDFMRGGVITIGPLTSLKTAAKIMSQNNIGCLPVIDEDEILIGIVTSTDFLDLYSHDVFFH